MKDVILVIGSSGQIGTELVLELRKMYGNTNVVASDIRLSSDKIMQTGPFEELDVLNKTQLLAVVKKHKITQVYLLAALLSATAEQHPDAGWKLNMEGLLNVLDLCKKMNISKLFWPSTIAVFGPTKAPTTMVTTTTKIAR